MQVQTHEPKCTLSRNTASRLLTLRKKTSTNQLYASYEDGQLVVFDLNGQKLQRTIPIYKNMPVIDFNLVGDYVATCTHTEVTIHNIEKSKSISMRGHETTPMFLTVHPISPLVLSCSNLMLLHDIRIQKPINVQFITPPAYGLEYFPDGQFFLQSGEPCRIGNTRWVRTLMNGMSRVSRTGKHIVTNDMNGKICLWDWRDSTQLLTLSNIKNHEVYQPVYFGTVDGKTRKILFLDEDSNFLNYDIVKQQMNSFKIPFQDGCKLYIDSDAKTTDEFFRFSHSGLIESYRFDPSI